MKNILIKTIKSTFTRELVSYLICGVLTTLLSFFIYGLCVVLGFGIVSSNTVSTVIAVVSAYFLNRIYVFRSATHTFGDVLIEFIKFASGRILTFIMETAMLILLTYLLSESDLMKIFSKLFTTVLVIVSNYFISKWLVF